MVPDMVCRVPCAVYVIYNLYIHQQIRTREFAVPCLHPDIIIHVLVAIYFQHNFRHQCYMDIDD